METISKSYIDVSALEHLMDDDVTSLKKVLNELLLSSIANSERLYLNFQEKKWESLKSTAHFLKGNARYIGNKELLNLLRSIEHEAIHNQDYNQMSELIFDYKHLMNLIKAEISVYISRLNSI
jgi:HPt (histidine-containing phosphotransfer) domain-containing protein